MSLVGALLRGGGCGRCRTGKSRTRTCPSVDTCETLMWSLLDRHALIQTRTRHRVLSVASLLLEECRHLLDWCRGGEGHVSFTAVSRVPLTVPICGWSEGVGCKMFPPRAPKHHSFFSLCFLENLKSRRSSTRRTTEQLYVCLWYAPDLLACSPTQLGSRNKVVCVRRSALH